MIRGYKELALDEDRLTTVGHVIFTLHGMAQKLESNDITETTAGYILLIRNKILHGSDTIGYYNGICLKSHLWDRAKEGAALNDEYLQVLTTDTTKETDRDP